MTVGGDEGDDNDNIEILIDTFSFDTYESAVELAQLAAAIVGSDVPFGVRLVPPNLHTACIRRMGLPKNIALHKTETRCVKRPQV